MTMSQAPDSGTVLTIDLAALAENWRRLAARVHGAGCAAALKADAYGTGIEGAVPALAGAGARCFFVAHMSEAERVRAAAPGATIYMLNGLLPGMAKAHAVLGLRPVLGSRAELAEWAAFCRSAGKRLPGALHVDTGMNRLGFSPDDARGLPATAGDDLAAIDPALLMSHFIASEEPDNPLNARQIAEFAAIRRLFPSVPASLCNSSGIFLAEKPFLDLVRPGYALYGGNPCPQRENPMRPVVRLSAPIIQTRQITKGATVGYNATWTARAPSRLATVPLGYGDGYPRSAGGNDERPGAHAIVAGQRCPIVGRVSMDLIVLDVSTLPEALAQRGTAVTFLGDGIGVDDVAAHAGTNGYEILTRLGRRYARRYVNADAGAPAA